MPYLIDELFRPPGREEHPADRAMRLRVDLHRHRRDARIFDRQLFEVADVERDVARGQLARPARRRHVSIGARIDQPPDRGEFQVLGRVKGQREAGALDGAIARIPVAGRLDERPAVECGQQLAARRIPPRGKKVFHRRSEADEAAVIDEAQADRVARRRRRGEANPCLPLVVLVEEGEGRAGRRRHGIDIELAVQEERRPLHRVVLHDQLHVGARGKFVILVDARIDRVGRDREQLGRFHVHRNIVAQVFGALELAYRFRALPQHLAASEQRDFLRLGGIELHHHILAALALDVGGEEARGLVIEQRGEKTFVGAAAAAVHDEVERAADGPAGIGCTLGRRPELERARELRPRRVRKQEDRGRDRPGDRRVSHHALQV